MTEQNRNLNPHAEARLAMVIWQHEYAYEQTGGSMDFWDSRTDRQKALCVSIVDAVMKAAEENGRAGSPSVKECGTPAPQKKVVATQKPAITVEFCQKIITEMGLIIGALQAELDKGKTP